MLELYANIKSLSSLFNKFGKNSIKNKFLTKTPKKSYNPINCILWVSCRKFDVIFRFYRIIQSKKEAVMILNAIIERTKEGYFAYIPEFKGCVSQGHTYEEAVLNIKEAGELYLESLKDKEILDLQAKITSIVALELNA